MDSKVLFKHGDSCIVIKNDHLYIMSTKYKDISPKALTLFPGFQIEMNRDIKEIRKALTETRLPLIILKVRSRENVVIYNIVRIATGAVDDKVLANVVCVDDKITKLVLNRELKRDMKFRKFNSLSIIYQLTLPYNLSDTPFYTRRDQAIDAVSKLAKACICENSSVTESGKTLCVESTLDKDGTTGKSVGNEYLKIIFLLNETGTCYELSSIEYKK